MCDNNKYKNTSTNNFKQLSEPFILFSKVKQGFIYEADCLFMLAIFFHKFGEYDKMNFLNITMRKYYPDFLEQEYLVYILMQDYEMADFINRYLKVNCEQWKIDFIIDYMEKHIF